MKILYIGDIMAEPGISVVEKVLPDMVRERAIDFVIAQSENVSDGKGLMVADYERLRKLGIDAFTGGNHTIRRSELYPLLEDPDAPVLGPTNMHDCPGPGYKFVRKNGKKILVVSLLGSIVGKQADVAVDNPLTAIDAILATHGTEADYIAVNFHGDYSSEKVIIGHYLDGRVNLIVGDHWHVPTADVQILAKGTAHMSDVGMCGSLDSSLGITFDSVVPRWRDNVQTKNTIETAGRMQFNALLTEIDDSSNRAVSAEHIRKVW